MRMGDSAPDASAPQLSTLCAFPPEPAVMADVGGTQRNAQMVGVVVWVGGGLPLAPAHKRFPGRLKRIPMMHYSLRITIQGHQQRILSLHIPP